MDTIKKIVFPICILISSLALAGAIFFHALCNRYMYISPTTPIFDKLTGTYYTINNSNYEKITVKWLDARIKWERDLIMKSIKED